MPSSGIEYLARVQILQNFGKVYQEQVLEQVTESAVGCSFFHVVSFVQFSSGWRHCGMGFYGNLSFFLAEWGLLRAGFAEIVLLHEAWPTASEFRRDRSSRFYYLQHFAGKCGICMPEVIGTQWLFLHIFSMCSFSVPCSSSQTSSGGSC